MIGQHLLAVLILIPFIGYLTARRIAPTHRFLILGVAFGAIVSPWALGMYSFYFWSTWGLVPGFIGLALMLLHGPPGFKLAILLGAIPAGVVSDESSNVIIESINGIVWALVYGFVGFTIDRFRNRPRYGGTKSRG